MSSRRQIGFSKVKFVGLQGAVAFAFAFCVPWFLGGDFPIRLRLVFATLGALMFAGFALVLAHLLAGTLEGDYVENAFPALGRGRVNLKTAKLAKCPHPLLFRIIDEESHATAALPRAFWSDDPSLVAEILMRVKGGT
ncbi:MAG TPA: hypothetical protein VJA21_09700 [Verrucomicrobiae bacterium]